jgi:hypothetical protein
MADTVICSLSAVPFPPCKAAAASLVSEPFACLPAPNSTGLFRRYGHAAADSTLTFLSCEPTRASGWQIPAPLQAFIDFARKATSRRSADMQACDLSVGT